MGAGNKRGHPLLRGGGVKRERYTHGFSASQMAALTAICGALVPSLPPDRRNGHQQQEDGGRGGGDGGNKVVEVAERMSRKCPPEALALVRTVLWLLGTRLGSLALCGARCLSWRFPFVRRFDELPLEQREALLRRWSRQTLLPPLRMFFLITKAFCLHVFYSWTDENSKNPHWRAIGYSPPLADDQPAPAESERPEKRPLDDGVVETTKETDASLPALLAAKGLTVADDSAQNVCRVECDVVIVGSGCGGGVAAAVLAGAGHKVVVMEKGNYFTARDYTAIEAPSIEQLYEGGGSISTLNGSAVLLAGSTVGGGTAVNWSACIKTPDDVREEWARDQGSCCSPPTSTPPPWTRRAPEQGPPQRVREARVQGGVGVEELVGGALLRQLRLRLPHRRQARHGPYVAGRRGELRRGDPDGVQGREAGAGAYGRWSCGRQGEAMRRRGGEEHQPGDHEDAGGARQGDRLGVRVAPDAGAAARSGLSNRHIGNNLHLHPTSLVWGYFPDTMPDLKGKMYEGGIITSLHKERMLRYSRTVHLFSLVRDRGCGIVHGERRVEYHLDATDGQNMREGLRRALRILAAAGAAEIGTHRSDGQRFACRGATEAALEEFLDGVDVVRGPQSKAEAWSLCCTAHQMGSCRMGATARDGAVDARGESWEAESLYVCDGSALPSAVGVNPMVTIQSVAYCLATGIAESLRRGTVPEKDLVIPPSCHARSPYYARGIAAE
ncbi:unnamed protein product [Miscanthus lutarioriparius]|uniref:Long-chain-alcohol oxidase n=1 Tax=Miscanthus lutarioriparius TaxID=422564 RepID=A0A811SLB8_9POAL|nr:unnamed protein product [Miscanthus lutarioriparius]